MMTCLTGRFPEEKFCSPGSAKCILADLCFNSRPPSVLFWFPFFHEGEHPCRTAQRPLTLCDELSLCSSHAQMCSWIQSYRDTSVWEGGSRLQRFPRMLDNTGQLSRLWFTAGCLVRQLSSGSWLCLLNSNSVTFAFPKQQERLDKTLTFSCVTGADLRSWFIPVFE